MQTLDEILKNQEDFQKTLLEIHELDWTDTLNPVWWDLNYREHKKLLEPREFMNKIKYLKEATIIQEPYTALTLITLEIQGMEIPFLVTARSTTPKELQEYYQQKQQPNPFKDLGFAETKDTLKKYRERIDEEKIKLPNMFHPHIRGPFLGMINENNTIVYSTLNLREQNKYSKKMINKEMQKELRQKLEEENMPLTFFQYPLDVNDRLKKLYQYLQGHNVIALKRNREKACPNNPSFEETLHQLNEEGLLTQTLNLNAKQTQYFEYGKQENQWTYAPIQVQVDEQNRTIPILITNAYKNEHSALGIYHSHTEKTQTILPILDPYLAKEITEKIRQELQLETKTYFLNRDKGKNELKVPNEKTDKEIFKKYERKNLDWD